MSAIGGSGLNLSPKRAFIHAAPLLVATGREPHSSQSTGGAQATPYAYSRLYLVQR
jgi:hypothetical protein